MKRLDVLFVIPENLLDFKCAVPDAIEPPLEARYMANHLIGRGSVSLDLFDANVLGWTPEKMAKEVAAVNPHLVVVSVRGYNPSASHQTMVTARPLAQAIKNESPQTPIIFTGTHPSAVPGLTLKTEPIDYVCGGEGPITVYELLQVIKAGGRTQELRKVRSLWFLEDGAIVNTAPAPLIDLKKEPFYPEVWLRYMDPRKYTPHHWQRFYNVTDKEGNVLPEPYANPYYSFGCPFHCDFCEIQSPFREGEQALRLKSGVNSFRQRDPNQFLQEVTYLVEEFGVKFFKIPDEMFGLGEHPVTIAKLIKERFGDSLNFWCYFRVDTCNSQNLELLRSAGFRWLALGIEAADSKVRSRQDKHFKDDRIYKVVEGLHSAGIEGALNYIFGLPEDTMESMEKTFKMACELKGTYGNFYCTQALPGSELYRKALANGYPLPQRKGGPGWIGHAQYSFESEPYYEGSALTPPEILAFRDWAHLVYYTRPEYRAKIAKKFGEIALRNIDEWMKHICELKRALLGGRAFWELPREEQIKLVPAIAGQID